MATRADTFALDWELLFFVSDLYSRCLLTMGDDEFFNDGRESGADGAASAGRERNPLALNEVIGLSGVLRNVAFGLYWSDDIASGKVHRLSGTSVPVTEMRGLATRLLQQIYARDSRRQFTPDDFWLMTSAFDLHAFIQTALAEADEDDNEDGDSVTEIGPHSDMAVIRARYSSMRDRGARARSRRSPHLAILDNVPFVVPFPQRLAIFRALIEADRQRLGINPSVFSRRHRHRAIIRRGNVAEDGFKNLAGLGPLLKESIEITFVDAHGLDEAGIDGGGVFKEFLTSLSREAFDTDRGLWLSTRAHQLYPNPHTYARESHQLAWYHFLGLVLGKALYEGILVDVTFANAFLSKWLGRQSYLDDLASLDPELYNGLLFLKNYKGDVESDLSLNFTVTNEEFGVSKTLDLIANGRQTPVTRENRMQYIYLVAHYRLNVQTERQSSAFFSGLSEIINPKWTRLFNQAELHMLVSGTDQDIDVDDLEAHTVYGGWDQSHPTIRAFWRVVHDLPDAERRKVLKFVTSVARPPLLGFRQLNPMFAIRNAGDDVTRLPSASTCVNLLKLPAYADEATLREKLLYAVNAGAGFDLS